ncbi:MAG: TIGR02147 family protein [Chitinispirillaceae bacterium]|nr:TIGR02147 family protein [Chitinispirillaceae bacterium]
MLNIYEYLDYRQYLKDFYDNERKNKPWFSYRYISSKVKLNPGYIVKVFQGKVHLGIKNIGSFADLMMLSEKEREYFGELLHFGRAKNEDEIEQRFERLQSIKGVTFRTVADNKSEFFTQWYHMAIRSLISIYPFDGKDYRKLASMLSPKITAQEARESIELLEQLNMIKKNEDGLYRVTEQFISTGEKWAAAVIRNYQKKNVELSLSAIDMYNKELRDISSVTMTMRMENIDVLRKKIQQFRQELLLISQNEENDDAVVQLNIQLFPVASCTWKKEK